MSLDVYLTKIMPTEVYSSNITHNLGKMANQVLLSNGHTLYQVLWRPDEHGRKFARDIVKMLDEGWNILMSNPELFKKFNPENGWGSYEGLERFVYQYLKACWMHPEAEIGVSR